MRSSRRQAIARVGRSTAKATVEAEDCWTRIAATELWRSRTAQKGREQPTGAGSRNTRAGRGPPSLPGARGMHLHGLGNRAHEDPAMHSEWPALDISAGANFACDRKRLSSYRPCPCRRPLRPPPVPGPSTARSFAGRLRRAHACTCSRTCAEASRCRPYWPNSRWVVPWPHGWRRPRSAGPATGAAVGRAALGARPAGSLRMDCSLRRCSRAADSGWAFLEACRSTLAVGVGEPWFGARRSRRDADLVRRAAGAGPLVSRTLPAHQRGVTPRAGASAILATRWWERR